MKKNYIFKHLLTLGILLLNYSCKEDTDLKAEHNPNVPIEITKFEPTGGPAKTDLFIYGRNFGSDASLVSVKIGGQSAKVIGCDDDVIYCMVPFKASEGSVEVTIGPNSAYAKASEKFLYEKKTLVSTLAGYVDETGKTESKDGSFSEAGFLQPNWLMVDPHNKSHIFIVDNNFSSIRILDVERDSVYSILQKGHGNWNMIRTVNFTVSGDTLIVGNEHNVTDGLSTSITVRSNEFRRPQPIAYARRNQCSVAHPINGELYHNSRTTGDLYKYDWATGKSKRLYTVKNRECCFFIFFHPSGNYAYFTVPTKQLIMKAEYDWEKGELKVPNNFVGKEGSGGYADGQGVNARLGNPYQGCFIKNEKYVKEGKEDVYDFYFADQAAHAIRYVTPDGFVYTYAGRGSKGLNNNPSGWIDGDLLQEARFKSPGGICYDEENKIFYIADSHNHRIRMIKVDE